VSRLVLVGGGARSGKSSFALAKALALGKRRVFVATAQALDSEMQARIARHVRERGESFQTVEAPLDLPDAVATLRDIDVAVIDCLTLWLSNLLVNGRDESDIDAEVTRLLFALSEAPFDVVLVTNEVGMGVVPESVLGRLFRDVTGRVHQRMAARATDIYFAVMGCIVRLRPSPVSLEPTAGATS
jgi:adenosylcobinamide kinase/adenosylcobinamide-phosphate guanylyltransferase